MLNSYSAEFLKIRKRPAVWVISGLWFTLLLAFTYLFPYLRYRQLKNSVQSHQSLIALLPSNFAGHSLIGLPLWGGAFIVVLGALVIGSEYGWGTLKTLFTIKPSRLKVFVAQLEAVFSFLAALVIIYFSVMGVLSIAIANSAHITSSFPSDLTMLRSLGAGWIILCMWCLFGITLAILIRGTALSIGLGLVWLLVIESLIKSVASDFSFMADLEKYLPGVNAGSLVASFSPVISGGGGTSVGVNGIVGGAQAFLVVLMYIAAFLIISGTVLSSRDVH